MKAALFPLLFLLGIVGAAPLGAAQAPQEAPKVSLRSVQANFFQEKHLKILAQPISARGVFAFQAPRSLRWEYLYPLHTLLLVTAATSESWWTTMASWSKRKAPPWMR